MPRYLVERQFSVGQEQMNAVGRRSREISEERYPGITWEHSHVAVGDDGRVKTFCLYAATNEAEIRNHAQELGQHEILRISEIVGDVTPADFPS
jgi:Nickel responsive protein SCO4226-like